MRIFKTTLFFLLLSLSALAGDSTRTGSRFAIGINVSPDYCFRTLSNNDGSQSSSDVLNVRNGMEIPKIGYTAGIGLSCIIKKHFSVEIGVAYSNKGYQTVYQDIYLSPTQMPDPALPKRYKSRYNFSYIDFPLIAHFQFGKKKLSFVASAGAVTNLLLYEKVISIKDFGDGNVKKEKGLSNYIYNPINISPMISIGCDLKLGKKADLKVEPVFRYGVLQIIDSPVTGHLWNAGLNIGCYIRL